MTSLLKMLPLLLAWGGIVALLLRCYGAHGKYLWASSAMAFSGGVFGCAALLATVRGDLPYSVIKCATSGSFILFWMVASAALYRTTGKAGLHVAAIADRCSHLPAYSAALLAGLLAGALSVCRLLPQGRAIHLEPLLLLVATGALLAVAAVACNRMVLPMISLTNASFLAMVVSLLLFMSAFTLRLDLFSPLTMKVMKFIHDFVHQFFEAMLIPDHPFFRTDVWNYIGYLFSSGVGFWGGMAVWFTPALLTLLSIQLEPLPSVAHIRQGAKRRKLLAAFIRERRCRLIVPWLAVVVLAGAVYQSRFPAVEYWNPQPVAVTVKPSGEIFIPRKGEIDLEDGKLHKYACKQGGQEARFMILMGSDGRLTATLDACAICKPQGYGQTEGSVICFYCKTLIPLETVGKPGGCNPVPIPFKAGPDGVTLDALTLFNRWSETVTATAKSEGGGK
jgi:hypothetical protein